MTNENIKMSYKDGKTESWEKTIRDGNMTKCIRVEKVENGKVFTIEGNSKDEVREKSYNLSSKSIYGYGV